MFCRKFFKLEIVTSSFGQKQNTTNTNAAGMRHCNMAKTQLFLRRRAFYCSVNVGRKAATGHQHLFAAQSLAEPSNAWFVEKTSSETL